MNQVDFISGERLQNIAKQFLYIANSFREALCIHPRDDRYVQLRKDEYVDNESVVYINSSELYEFLCDYSCYLKNPYVVLSHNSDQNLYFTSDDSRLLKGLEDPKCLGVYTQNPSCRHPKIHLLPIGIANSKWPHGNPAVVERVLLSNPTFRHNKKNDIYFFFNEDTNRRARVECKISLFRKLPWSQHTPDFLQYLAYLSSYKYAICPEGNGHDTHRVWECIYTQVIPIMKRTVFSELVSEYLDPHPIILLDEWYTLNVGELLQSYAYPDYPVYGIQALKNKIS